MTKKYKVTCLECKESDVHTFDERQHVLVHSDKILNTPLLGVRWRPDLKWGFRCRCGNYSLIAPQESDQFDNLVTGDELSIKKMAESLLIPDEKQFSMEVV